MSNSPSGGSAIGVIGCGHWGRHIVRILAEMGNLAAVADLDATRAKALAEAHGVRAAGFEAVFADPNIGAVAIAAPAAEHYRLAKLALEAGKHVFVEKPITLEFDQAVEIKGLADRRGLTLMVGHLLQYHPAFETLKELAHDGRFGNLQYTYSNRLNLGKFRQEENILWSFAPHDISMILALIGAEPVRVAASGAAFLQHEIADVTVTNLDFPGGEQAHIFVSWLHPFKEQKLVVVGDAAMAVFNDGEDWSRKLLIYDHKIEWHRGQPEPTHIDPVEMAIPEGEPLAAEMAHFVHCVETGARPRTDGDEAIRVLKVLKQAEQAVARGPAPAEPGLVRFAAS